VTAKFAANVDWSLEIQDVSSNTVRYVTGSGGSMSFNWDGTGTNGITIPDGLYSYVLTAQTNGAPLQGGGGAEGGGAPPSPMMAALASGETSYFAEPPPMPPVKKDGIWYSWEEIFGPLPPIEVKIPETVQNLFLKSLEALAGQLPGSSIAIAPENFGGQNMMFAGATQATKAPNASRGSESRTSLALLEFATRPTQGVFSPKPRELGGHHHYRFMLRLMACP